MATPKQVKGFLLNPTDDRIGISTSWLANDETDIDHYNLFRIGTGILSVSLAATSAIFNGDTLEIIVDGDRKQTITFSNAIITDGAATAQELVDNINATLVDASAAISLNSPNDQILIRAASTEKSASVQVVGGNSNAILGFPSGIFWSNQQIGTAQKITEVAAPTISFIDLDGLPLDLYFVEAENTSGLIGQRSVTNSLIKVVDEIPQRIFIHGIITDASGAPVENANIILRPCEGLFPSVDYETFNLDLIHVKNANFGISFVPSIVTTDADGYFEILAFANTKLRLTIPHIQYDRAIITKNGSQKFTELDIWHGEFFS